jgi:transcriptional regulator with XRE-family HTH domain
MAELAESLGLSRGEYEEIERGESPLEQLGPRMLRFAEAIEQPLFNLFYPCGLPLESLEDYP